MKEHFQFLVVETCSTSSTQDVRFCRDLRKSAPVTIHPTPRPDIARGFEEVPGSGPLSERVTCRGALRVRGGRQNLAIWRSRTDLQMAISCPVLGRLPMAVDQTDGREGLSHPDTAKAHQSYEYQY